MLEDVTAQHPSLAEVAGVPGREAREIENEFEIQDRLRGRRTAVRIYAEGWIDIEIERRRKPLRHMRLDLRYLDPIPTIRRRRPRLLLKIGGGLTALTALAATLASFGLMFGVTLTAAIVAGLAAAGCLFWAYYLSHEKITFHTLHGRAPAIRFGAGLGTIRRFRKLVPEIVAAIVAAATTIGDDTAIFLRSEMREHYRLRNDGILSEAECAESTGRILTQFDDPV